MRKKILSFLFNSHVNSGMNAIGKFSEAMIPITKNNGIFSFGKFISAVYSEYCEGFIEKFDYHDGDYNNICAFEFSNIAYEALRNKSNSTIISSQRGTIDIIKIDNIEFYCFLQNKKGIRVCNSIYVLNDHSDSKKIIQRKIFEKYQGRNLILCRANEDGQLQIKFEEGVSLSSKKSEDLYQNFKSFLDLGLNRSVLLYGMPGTGKSICARDIIKKFGFSYVKLRLSDLNSNTGNPYSGNNSSDFFDSIYEFFKNFPMDAVILDDFDRVANNPNCLELLEILNKKCRLVIITVNDKDSIDPAIIRPGRVDELIEVNKIDEDVIQQILGINFKEYFERVKDFPVVFIEDFSKTIKAFPENKEMILFKLETLNMRLKEFKKTKD